MPHSSPHCPTQFVMQNGRRIYNMSVHDIRRYRNAGRMPLRFHSGDVWDGSGDYMAEYKVALFNHYFGRNQGKLRVCNASPDHSFEPSPDFVDYVVATEYKMHNSPDNMFWAIAEVTSEVLAKRSRWAISHWGKTDRMVNAVMVCRFSAYFEREEDAILAKLEDPSVTIVDMQEVWELCDK